MYSSFRDFGRLIQSDSSGRGYCERASHQVPFYKTENSAWGGDDKGGRRVHIDWIKEGESLISGWT